MIKNSGENDKDVFLLTDRLNQMKIHFDIEKLKKESSYVIFLVTKNYF